MLLLIFILQILTVITLFGIGVTQLRTIIVPENSINKKYTNQTKTYNRLTSITRKREKN